MKKLIIFIFALCALNCSKKEHLDSSGTIVAYTSSKHSKIWILEANSKRVEPVKTGKFMEPINELGATINIKYSVNNNNSIKITFDQKKYMRKSENWLNYSKSLRGYENLIQ